MMLRDIPNMTAALAYADVFDYPLTADEARYWAVGGVRLPRVPTETDGTYFVLSGRKAIIAVRKKRMRIAPAKWRRVRRVSGLFRMIPTVMLVGVTGGLAMNNANKDDDIDLFFIVRSGTLWISRMCITLVAEVAGVRRHPGDHDVSDKVCLNMFMAEDSLALPSGERDVFSAHEVLQMVPLWDTGGAHRKLLLANRWAAEYLPNAWREQVARVPGQKVTAGRGTMLWGICRVLEPVARQLQLRYMAPRRTDEVIVDGMIRFHPLDARRWIRKKLYRRLRSWDIPLDKFFYHR